MSIGPVEYLVLGFPDNNFTGQIAPELMKLVDDGLINIIDLTFISKDVDGNVAVVEFDAVEELAAFADLDAEIGGILSDEDIAHAALSLEPNTSAALLIWEDAWAAPFRGGSPRCERRHPRRRPHPARARPGRLRRLGRRHRLIHLI